MNNLGVLRLSYDDLAGMLNLPVGHTITAIAPQTGDDMGHRTFSIIVSGPQLPTIPEGACLPLVSMVRTGRGKTEFC